MHNCNGIKVYDKWTPIEMYTADDKHSPSPRNMSDQSQVDTKLYSASCQLVVLATYCLVISKISILACQCRTMSIPFKRLFMCAWTSSHLHELMSDLYTFSFSLPMSRAMPAGPRAVPKTWFSLCRCPARWVGTHAPVSANNKQPLLLQPKKTQLIESNMTKVGALHLILHLPFLCWHLVCWLSPSLDSLSSLCPSFPYSLSFSEI